VLPAAPRDTTRAEDDDDEPEGLDDEQ
jgi:hypothetical protein